MTKNEYLAQIRRLFGDYRITKTELEDILNDYGQMWDDAAAQGLSEDEIMAKLGQPEKVVLELGENCERRQDGRGNGKIIAIMPFFCVAVFMGLGLSPLHLWHPGWMVFLLIPISAILVGMRKKRDPHILTALSPFFAVTAFLILGFGWSLWHPGWLVFLIIPFTALVVSAKQRTFLQTLTALSPFIAVVAFIFLGMQGWWHPGWLVFLLIPMLGILNHPKTWIKVGFEACLLGAVGIYLYSGYGLGLWKVGAFAFALPVLFGILTGDIRIRIGGQKSLPVLITVVTAIIVYLGAGLIWGETFAWLWVIFLAIPVVAIVTNAKKKDILIAISPFLATTLFFLLGYFANAWVWSWLVFLLIPVIAILRDKG
jgi:hypothetical protein